MSELWLPGASGPLDGLVSRIQSRIDAYAERVGTAPAVEVELRDGTTAVLQSLEAEPGFGFVTLRPHGEDGADEEWIVPIGAVARIVLRTAEAHEPFGFAA